MRKRAKEPKERKKHVNRSTREKFGKKNLILFDINEDRRTNTAKVVIKYSDKKIDIEQIRWLGNITGNNTGPFY